MKELKDIHTVVNIILAFMMTICVYMLAAVLVLHQDGIVMTDMLIGKLVFGMIFFISFTLIQYYYTRIK